MTSGERRLQLTLPPDEPNIFLTMHRCLTGISFIAFVSLIHLVEGYLLIRHITEADWTYPMRAFLFFAGGRRVLSGMCIGACGLSGLCGVFFRGLSLNTQIAMFMAQTLPIVLVAIWIIGWACLGIDAYGGHQSTVALLLNQAPRLWWVLFYPIAVLCVLNRH